MRLDSKQAITHGTVPVHFSSWKEKISTGAEVNCIITCRQNIWFNRNWIIVSPAHAFQNILFAEAFTQLSQFMKGCDPAKCRLNVRKCQQVIAFYTKSCNWDAQAVESRACERRKVVNSTTMIRITNRGLCHPLEYMQYKKTRRRYR